MGSSHSRSSSHSTGSKNTINSNNYQGAGEPDAHSAPSGTASGPAGVRKPKSGGDVIEGDYHRLD